LWYIYVWREDALKAYALYVLILSGCEEYKEYKEKFLSIDKALNLKVALIGDIFSHENQEPVGHNTFTERTNGFSPVFNSGRQ
jgi:hypothetical protein